MMKLFELQVEINILTGETKILQADIIYDCGKSMNPAVDLGQVSYLFLNTYPYLLWLLMLNFTFGLHFLLAWFNVP